MINEYLNKVFDLIDDLVEKGITNPDIEYNTELYFDSPAGPDVYLITNDWRIHTTTWDELLPGIMNLDSKFTELFKALEDSRYEYGIVSRMVNIPKRDKLDKYKAKLTVLKNDINKEADRRYFKLAEDPKNDMSFAR